MLTTIALCPILANGYPWHEFLTPANIPNEVLVVVGGGGIVAALLTLRVIKKQADLMAQQDKTARSKQRARLSIVFPLDAPSVGGMIVEDTDGLQSQMLQVTLSIINDGETRAFNVRASGYFLTEPIQIGKIYPSYGDDLDIAKVIGAADIEHPIPVSLTPAQGRIQFIPREDWQAVTVGKVPMHVIGTISYEDVFGDSHRTPFWYVWQVPGESSWDDDEGSWSDSSGEST